jgi:hypothetical protein
MKLREDGTSPRSLDERAADAQARILRGQAPMQIPPDDADPDLVIAAMRKRLIELEAEATRRALSEVELRGQLADEKRLREEVAAEIEADTVEMVAEHNAELAAARAERDLHKAALEKAQAERPRIEAAAREVGYKRFEADLDEARGEAAMLREALTACREGHSLMRGYLGHQDQDANHAWMAEKMAGFISAATVALALPSRAAEWLAEQKEQARETVAALQAEIEAHKADLESVKSKVFAIAEDRATMQVRLSAALAFKTYVHKRLDDAGVPADPEPETNAKTGCRIGGRLNWLIHGRDAQRKMNEATHAAFHEVSRSMHSPGDNGAELLRKVADERAALAAEAREWEASHAKAMEENIGLTRALDDLSEKLSDCNSCCDGDTDAGGNDVHEHTCSVGRAMAFIAEVLAAVSDGQKKWLAEHDARARDLRDVELEVSVHLWRDPKVQHDFVISKLLCEFEEARRRETLEEAAKTVEAENPAWGHLSARQAARRDAAREIRALAPRAPETAPAPVDPIGGFACPICGLDQPHSVESLRREAEEMEAREHGGYDEAREIDTLLDAVEKHESAAAKARASYVASYKLPKTEG